MSFLKIVDGLNCAGEAVYNHGHGLQTPNEGLELNKSEMFGLNLTEKVALAPAKIWDIWDNIRQHSQHYGNTGCGVFKRRVQN